MEKISVVQARKAEAVGKHVLVQGWVRTRRDSKGGFSFIELNDGSSFGNLQVVAPGALPNYQSEVLHLSVGASLRVSGEVKASPAKGQATEVHADSITLVGGADSTTYPLQKKGHTFEFLRTIAHLRPRSNTFGAVTRVRNCVCYSIHQFFQEQGFYYVHPPIITASDAEGAGQLFRVTALDLGKLPRNEAGEVDLAKPFVRLSYTEAVDILQKSGQTFDFLVAWGADLQSEHERFLTEQHFQSPVILYDYPKAIKAFYMRVNDDGRTVRAMDVLVPRV